VQLPMNITHLPCGTDRCCCCWWWWWW